MYNQIEAILEQYDIEIRQITKGRGTYICDTKEGKKILTPFRGSIERGGRLRECLWKLQSIGFPVEQVVINKEQTSVTVDAVTGERFMLLDYTEGIELNPLKEDDVVAGARLLGEYHSLISKLDFENAVVSEKDKAVEIKIRHYKELIKIRNHIRNKKKKNDFERLFLANAMSLVEVAEKSIEHLQQVRYRSCDYMFCHGDYNQHNTDFLIGIFAFIGLLRLAKFANTGLARAAAAVYTVISVAFFLFDTRFKINYDFRDLLTPGEASFAYNTVELLGAVQLVAFLATLVFTVIAFRKFILNHTALSPEDERYSRADKEFHSSLIRKTFVAAALAALAMLSHFVNIFVSGDVRILETELYDHSPVTLIMPSIPWFGLVVAATSIAFIAYSFYYINLLKEEVRMKYIIE